MDDTEEWEHYISQHHLSAAGCVGEFCVPNLSRDTRIAKLRWQIEPTLSNSLVVYVPAITLHLIVKQASMRNVNIRPKQETTDDMTVWRVIILYFSRSSNFFIVAAVFYNNSFVDVRSFSLSLLDAGDERRAHKFVLISVFSATTDVGCLATKSPKTNIEM